MSNEKLLTISIASYNVEKCLSECLDSLLLENENFEYLDVIIVNDGSKDGTLSVAKKYIDMFPDVFRVVDKENGGYGSTINSSSKIARGMYYKLLDADDLYDKDGLNALINYIKKNGDDDMIITPYVKNFVDVGKYTQVNEVDSNLKGECVSKDNFTVIPAMHAICIKTELLTDINIQEHCFYTDNEFVAFALIKSNSFSSLDKPVYIYNLGLANQSVSINGLRKHLDDWEKVYRAIYELTKISNIDSKKKEMINSIQKELVNAMYLAYMVQEQPIKYKSKLKDIDVFIKTNDTEIYELTNEIKTIHIVRVMNFSLYSLISWFIKRRIRRKQ